MRIIKRYCPQTAADIALKGKLFVSGWCLSNTLKSIRKWNHCVKIILAYEDGIPVGVMCQEAHNSPVQVFVKKAFRRKGIGTKLANAWKKDGYKLHVVRGTDASVPFYKTFGINLY